MKITCIKDINDKNSFKSFERIGMDVIKLDDPEQIDNTIKELVNNEYNIILLTNEIAGFSEDIVKKYKKDPNINIIIGISK